MGISQKSLRHTHFRFFGISWNIGIFKKKYGTNKNGKKWNIPDFWDIPEYSIFQIRDKGGGGA